MFLLISCSLQRFYFVKKIKQKTKLLWRNPTIAQLSTNQRSQSNKRFFFSRDVTLWPIGSLVVSHRLFHFFHKCKQNNKVRVECLLFPCHRCSLQSLVQKRNIGSAPDYKFLFCFLPKQSSVDDFVDCGLLVP